MWVRMWVRATVWVMVRVTGEDHLKGVSQAVLELCILYDAQKHLVVVREARVRACCGEGSKSKDVLWWGKQE